MTFRRISLAALAGIVASLLGSGPLLAGTLGYAVVPTQIIYPGEIIDTSKLDIVEVTNPDLATGYAKDVTEVNGMVSTRTLLPGRTITVSHLRYPFTVRRGAEVALTYDNNGLKISARGTPLQDGSTGETVKVRNVDSGLIVSGTVLEDGSIRVTPK